MLVESHDRWKLPGSQMWTFRRSTHCSLDCRQVLTGQEFSRVKDLPAKWLVETVLVKAARAISPSVEIGPLSTPSLLVPVVALAQCITVRSRMKGRSGLQVA